mgnify:CR=1 FL=1
MGEIAQINGVNVGSISKINGVAKSSIANMYTHTFPAAGTPTNYLNENFDSLVDGTNYPTNWDGSTGLTVYGSTTSTHQWRANDYRTNSSTSGPNAHHGGSDSSGAFGNSTSAYMYTEASGIYNKNHLLRTPQLDFTNALDNNTLKLTFWFHMYSSSAVSGYMGQLMVGTSNSATSAADGTIGTGFAADAEAGGRTGMSIEFWDDDSDDGSSTTTAIVIEERQQTEGHSSTAQAAYWRKATVDLTSVVGESSCYIWFYAKTGNNYRSDICIDTVKVDGEE